ncbi:MAG: hypothetical protein FJ202_13430 [Gemmatimonadetes bacterium]|nr:hypothetical protein [Gemmatimonadota bacterium]
MIEIIVPTINTNDVDAVLRQWVKKAGDRVAAGELIAVLETTKASYELESPAAGILEALGEEGQSYAFGAAIGAIHSDEASLLAARAARQAAPAAASGGPVITAAAQRLIDKLGLTPQQVAAIRKRVIKESDVQALAEPSAGGGAQLSAQQQTIARTVGRSHATIPDAFLLQKIDVTAALTSLIAYRERHKAMVGLPDLLVWSVAQLTGSFPMFFGQLDDSLAMRTSTAGNIGVTMDVGRGLYVPVLREASSLTLLQASAQLSSFRMKALRNTFEAADLAGGDLSISLNTDEGTVLVKPIILPPQTCMLSVGAVLKELVLAGTTLIERSYVLLGVTYDHRAINGFQAGAFARAIKSLLEAPEVLER